MYFSEAGKITNYYQLHLPSEEAFRKDLGRLMEASQKSDL